MQAIAANQPNFRPCSVWNVRLWDGVSRFRSEATQRPDVAVGLLPPARRGFLWAAATTDSAPSVRSQRLCGQFRRGACGRGLRRRRSCTIVTIMAVATSAIDMGPAASIGSASHAIAYPRPQSTHVQPACR